MAKSPAVALREHGITEVLIAAKHQSWGDGFATYDQFDDLAFVKSLYTESNDHVPSSSCQMTSAMPRSSG